MNYLLFYPISAFVLVMMLPLQAAFAAPSPNLKCQHLEGDRLFKGAASVLLKRDGSWITVQAGQEDESTYRISFEDTAIGYRAYRAGSQGQTSSTLDVAFGGELFYIVDKEQKRLIVTAVNTSNGKVSSAVLICRDAP